MGSANSRAACSSSVASCIRSPRCGLCSLGNLYLADAPARCPGSLTLGEWRDAAASPPLATPPPPGRGAPTATSAQSSTATPCSPAPLPLLTCRKSTCAVPRSCWCVDRPKRERPIEVVEVQAPELPHRLLDRVVALADRDQLRREDDLHLEVGLQPDALEHVARQPLVRVVLQLLTQKSSLLEIEIRVEWRVVLQQAAVLPATVPEVAGRAVVKLVLADHHLGWLVASIALRAILLQALEVLDLLDEPLLHGRLGFVVHEVEYALGFEVLAPRPR
eukprot:7391492-Prymnesium_polylepis.2